MNMALPADFTLEFFGATTFRLRARGLTVFLDSWLERPSANERYLSIADVAEADYIIISHAHFDHLPGADILAKQTGAIVIGNCEAINILRKAGVPEPQLMAVQGGERIPLFSRETREQAEAGEIDLRPGPPGGPPIPHPSHAVLSVDVWPSLHCLIPEGHLPDVFDTATRYTGAAHSYVCTFDVNYGMKHGLLKLDKLIPEEKRSAGISSFIEYVDNREKWQFSDHDGGQLMYNIHVAEKKTILWNAHLGGYEGILRDLDPKPQMVILGIAGRANHDGRPFEGSGAEFASRQVEWLGRPDQLIWCLHDESVVPPYRVDTRAAREAVESMGTKVIDMEPNKLKHLTI